MTPDRTASVFLNLNGAVNAFTLDTGSTGIAASSKYYKPGPNDVAQGPGQVSYSSSGLSYKGTWYTTNVGIVQTAQVASGGSRAVPGAQLATSKGVSILAVTEQCDKSGTCSPAPADAISYMGVGYNRNALTGPPPAGSIINAFTSVTSLASGAPISTYRQGYAISNGGITLGLSTAATQNSGIIKLLPDTTKATPTGTLSTAPMTVLVNNGSSPNSGVLLPDTGINYMFLQSGPSNKFATKKCGSNFCAVGGTQIQVWLPGQTGTAAAFTYVAPDPKDVPPGRVENDGSSTSPFINTGRQFYENFTYFYDDIGGFVGYTAVPGGSWAAASTAPALALTGNVNLLDGFASSLPTVLYGATTLLQTGTGTISSTVSGFGGLTIGSGQVNLTGSNSYTGGTTSRPAPPWGSAPIRGWVLRPVASA